VIAATYSGFDIYLIDEVPDWKGRVSAEFDLVADLVAGLSNRESRRAYAKELRISSFRYSSLLETMQAWSAYEGLRNYQVQPVAMPFWPGVTTWADRAGRRIASRLNVVFKEDWSQWEIFEVDVAEDGIVENGEPSWPAAGDLVAPLLWGRLEKRELEWADGTTALLSVEFVEAGPSKWALRPVILAILGTDRDAILGTDGGAILEAGAVTWKAGPKPSNAWAVGPDVFPFEVNFDGPRTSFTVSIVREQIGFTREPVETVYAQANARGLEMAHAGLDGGAISDLLRFFLEHGAGKVFWAPAWNAATELTADVGATDTTLEVLDTTGIEVGDWLALMGPEGVRATARVLSKTDDSLEIDAAVGEFAAAEVLLTQLVLARFEKTRLELDWSEPELMTCSLSVREVPPEYTPAGDETLGTTLGLLPARAYIYEFRMTLAGTEFVERYTSYERDLMLGADMCKSERIEHTEIKQGIMLDKDEVEVRMRRVEV
jgi:hypothetical protein